MPGSEIARFRQEQAMQEQAARQGLQGFATVAPHKIITSRMEQDAPYLLQLLQDGKIEQCDQAISQMTTELSRREEGESLGCHTLTLLEVNDDA
jgi:hypothetical protein